MSDENNQPENTPGAENPGLQGPSKDTQLFDLGGSNDGKLDDAEENAPLGTNTDTEESTLIAQNMTTTNFGNQVNQVGALDGNAIIAADPSMEDPEMDTRGEEETPPEVSGSETPEDTTSGDAINLTAAVTGDATGASSGGGGSATRSITGSSGGGGSANTENNQTPNEQQTTGGTQSLAFEDDGTGGGGGPTVFTTDTPETDENQAPTAIADTAEITEDDGSFTIDVLGNDFDPEGDALTITDVTLLGSAPGVVTVEGGQLVYTFGEDFQSLDEGDEQEVEISYTITDTAGNSSTSTATILVEGTNDIPTIKEVVVDTSAGATEDGSTVSINVLQNYTDVDADAELSLASVSVDGYDDLVTVGADGQIEFTPGTHFQNLDKGDELTLTVNYTVTDEKGATVDGSTTVTVTGTNDIPTIKEVVVDTSAGATEDGSTVSINVLQNYQDVDADDNLSIVEETLSVVGGEGSVSLDQAGNIVFDPGEDFQYLATGETIPVTINFTVTDRHGVTVDGSTTVTVTGTNDGPVAKDVSGSGNEDTMISGDLMITDVDTPISEMTYVLDVQPENGSVVFNSDGTYTYTPNEDYHGEDSFTYTVSDGKGGTDTATVSLTVNEMVDGYIMTNNEQNFTPDFTNPNTTETVAPGERGTTESHDHFGASDQTYTVERGDDDSITVTQDETWNNLKSVRVESDEMTDLTIDNFVHAEVELQHDENSEVNIVDAKRGSVETGGGDDTINIDTRVNNTGWDTTFTVSSGDGDDTITVDGSEKASEGQYHTNISNATNIDAGAGDDTVTASMTTDTISGGDGADLVYGGAGDDVIYGGDMSDAEMISGQTVTYTVDPDHISLTTLSTNDEDYASKRHNPHNSVKDFTGQSGVAVFDPGDRAQTYIFSEDGPSAFKSLGSGDVKANLTNIAKVGDDKWASDFVDDGEIKNQINLFDENGNAADDFVEMVRQAEAGENGFQLYITGDDSIEITYDGRWSTDIMKFSGEFVSQALNQFDFVTAAVTDPIDDRLYGGDGDDSVYGGSGHDMIYGGDGADYLEGGDDNDMISADAGNDVAYGGTGEDHIRGRAGDDVLYGGDHNDYVGGGHGSDTVYGDAGADTLHGFTEADTLFGGTGNDVIYADDGIGFDADGNFTASLSLQDADSGEDVVYGDDGNDTMYGGGLADSLYGGDDNDVIYGGSGDDMISADAGNDVAYGGAGKDHIRGRAGDDVLYGGADNDYVGGGRGSDVVHGDGGDDTLHGYTESDTLFGGTGDDVIYADDGVGFDSQGNPTTGFTLSDADSGEDVVYGGDGNDTMYGGGLDDELHGGDDDDVLYGGSGNDMISADKGNDVLYGGEGDDHLRGRAGDDVLHGAEGNDYVGGGTGNDAVYGGDGADTVHGYTGDDSLYGGDGADTLFGEDGNDVMYGGDGVMISSQNVVSIREELMDNGSYETSTTETGINLVPSGRIPSEDGYDYVMTIVNGTDSPMTFQLGQYRSENVYTVEVPAHTSHYTVVDNRGTYILDYEGGDRTKHTGDGDFNHTDTVISAELVGADDTLFGGSGYDSLFGGSGNDILYGGDEAVTETPENLINNGSFEETTGLNSSWQVFQTVDDGDASTQDWQSDSGAGIEIQDRNRAPDGDNHVELDSHAGRKGGLSQSDILSQQGEAGGHNSNMFQMVETEAGKTYNLEFQFSPREGVSEASNAIQVLWEGQEVDILTADGSNGLDWNTYRFEVTASEEGMIDGMSRLEFKAVTLDDDGNIIEGDHGNSLGGYLDDVSLVAQSTEGDYIYGGEGDDLIYGGAGTDTLFGGEGNDTLAGGADTDYLYGGEGDDLFTFDMSASLSGDDWVYGGDGVDSMALNNLDANWTVSIDNGDAMKVGDLANQTLDIDGADLLTIQTSDGSLSINLDDVEKLDF